MNDLEALIKSILLILAEHKTYGGIRSHKTINDVLSIVMRRPNNYYNGDKDIVFRLVDILNNIKEQENVSPTQVIESLTIALKDKNVLVKIVSDFDVKDINEEDIKKRQEELKNYVDKNLLTSVLTEALGKAKRARNFRKLAQSVMEQLEPIISGNAVEDEALINSIDFANDEDIDKAVEASAKILDMGAVLKTGWSCINKMLVGGLRRGEMVMISALPHNYKSGFTKSLFLQLARLNEPIMDNPSKKPLMIFFSFEEETDVVTLFFYAYLKYVKEGVALDPDKDEVDKEEMKKYLRDHLREELKYNIKLLRLDPSNTTYRTIIKYVTDFEKMGYEVHAVFADYLSQISTEGCIQKGPAGTEYKDLFKKVRTEMSKRKILFVTPHQLSTEAKRLIRNGIPPLEFVKHLEGKGYYAHSSQLDQEVDLEIFLHKASLNRKPVLTVQRGKHRIPNSVVEDNLKYTILKFPRKAPIPEECEHMKPCIETNDEDDGFGF